MILEFLSQLLKFSLGDRARGDVDEEWANFACCEAGSDYCQADSLAGDVRKARHCVPGPCTFLAHEDLLRNPKRLVPCLVVVQDQAQGYVTFLS